MPPIGIVRIVFADAAATAPLKTLRYLFDEGCPYDESIAECAAAHGRLDVLETFPSTAKSGGVAVTSAAASHGHLPCLKYAVETLRCVFREEVLALLSVKDRPRASRSHEAPERVPLSVFKLTLSTIKTWQFFHSSEASPALRQQHVVQRVP